MPQMKAALATGVLAATALGAGLTATAGAAKSAGTTTCSSSGLRAERTSDGVTTSVGVSGLRARRASCSTARRVARSAAARELKGALGSRVLGYRVRYDRPCDGCTPRFDVTARRGSSRITFTLSGGA